jgi:hypothetical protein
VINKMLGKKLIAALAALIFILGAQMAMGKPVDGTVTYRGVSVSPFFFTVNEDSIVLAQNDKTVSENSEKSPSGSETDGSETAADDEKQSSEDKAKPLEPFVPSEKIPGDQAVDFPVDI